MRSSQIKIFFQVLLSAVLVFGLAVLIKNDLAKIQSVLTGNPLMRGLEVQRDQVKKKAILVTINHYRPDLSFWKDHFAQKIITNKRFLSSSVEYYEVISENVPQMVEAYHLLGFFHYLSGEKEAALVNQKKAVALEPNFFWAWYDLGIMYYREGQFLESAQAFRKALSTPPAGVLRFLNSSRILGEIIRASGSVEIFTTQRLQNGYRDAARMLEASMKRLRGQPVSLKEEDLLLKIF